VPTVGSGTPGTTVGISRREKIMKFLKIVGIALVVLVSAACSGSVGPVPAPSPGPTGQFVAADNPVRVSGVEYLKLVTGPAESGTRGEGKAYLYWPDLVDGEALVRVSVHLVNDSADVVELTDTSLTMTYGPNGVQAFDVPNGVIDVPSKIPPHGEAVIARDFVVPVADLHGSEITTGISETVDPSGPAQIVKVE
jgi:hypothetical protein